MPGMCGERTNIPRRETSPVTPVPWTVPARTRRDLGPASTRRTLVGTSGRGATRPDAPSARARRDPRVRSAPPLLGRCALRGPPTRLPADLPATSRPSTGTRQRNVTGKICSGPFSERLPLALDLFGLSGRLEPESDVTGCGDDRRLQIVESRVVRRETESLVAARVEELERGGREEDLVIPTGKGIAPGRLDERLGARTPFVTPDGARAQVLESQVGEASRRFLRGRRENSRPAAPDAGADPKKPAMEAETPRGVNTFVG